MKALIAIILGLAAVIAAPADLGDGFIHSKLAVFHHVSSHHGDGASAHKLRFVHLMPKASHLGSFSEGFGCAKLGHSLKLHNFISLGTDERLVELLGLSDCNQWHTVLLTLFNHHSGHIVHKPYSWVHGQNVTILDSVEALADFAHSHLTGSLGAHLFHGLVRNGLISHHFTHLLHAKLAYAIQLHVTGL